MTQVYFCEGAAYFPPMFAMTPNTKKTKTPGNGATRVCAC
jgi:hypothetical protein